MFKLIKYGPLEKVSRHVLTIEICLYIHIYQALKLKKIKIKFLTPE